ncbi:MAG: ATP-binding protein [Fibrobacteria bacterium]
MIDRPDWVAKIRESWNKAPIVWLSGVRRSGKTTLSRSFSKAKYLNCDLPSTAAILEDPEAFFSGLTQPELVLDEIHQLPDPSRILKIAADAFPDLRVLATGASTLAATQKFRDSLAGRKRSLTLVPVLLNEMQSFGVKDAQTRLFRGGLPPALLDTGNDESFYAEWLDSYYARDVQELFRVEKRSGFLKLLEILLRQSGGILDAVSLAKSSGLSRPTVLNYLEVFELTHVVHILRPYHGGGRQEILKQPKAYGFDTGFVRFVRGWSELSAEDLGLLWEHVILDLLLTLPLKEVHYWRTKQRHEIDFVIPQGRDACDAIECKWKASGAETRNFMAFRNEHAKGRNIIVSANQMETSTRKMEGLEFIFTNARDLISLF